MLIYGIVALIACNNHTKENKTGVTGKDTMNQGGDTSNQGNNVTNNGNTPTTIDVFSI